MVREGSPRQGGARDSRERPSHRRPFRYKYRTLLQMNTAAMGRGLTGIPLPPGCLPTLWGDDQRFIDSYLSRHPGAYLTGDCGYLAVGHDVADRVPDQGAEFGAGDVIERVSGHEQPPEHRAQ